MHRAPASAPSALLMATATAALLVARVHSNQSNENNQTSAIAALNPWLSACDLVQPGITDDLQGICSATTQTTMPLPLTQGPGPPKQPAQKCPPQCRHSSSSIINTHNNKNNNNYDDYNNNNNNNNTTSNQCLLYLEESHKDAVCSGGKLEKERRKRQVSSLRLRHCCEHAVNTVLQDKDFEEVQKGGDTCRKHLDALLEIDALAARISCEFTEVLTRYDCGQTYSIVYHCDDCKEAYRRWVCSSLVPHLTKQGRIRPCRSICQTVEQRCPYMLPGDRAPAYPTQYAGEPTFLCLDPNIPETGKQKERSSHGDEDCCYAYCGTPGRPPCVTCPRGSSNATWTAVQCPPPVPPKPPSGPTGCRGGLLTAPIPPVATSSASPSSRTSRLTWPTWRRQRRRRHKNLIINNLLNTLICGANQNGDDDDDDIKQKKLQKYEIKEYEYDNMYMYEYDNDYEYELNELWTTTSTSRLLIVVVVAFALLMLNDDEVTTNTAVAIFTFPIELILILKLILLIPTTLLLKLKCVQRARTWIQYNINIIKIKNIKTNNNYHWTISQHTHTHSHHHHHYHHHHNYHHHHPQNLNQNTPDTTS